MKLTKKIGTNQAILFLSKIKINLILFVLIDVSGLGSALKINSLGWKTSKGPERTLFCKFRVINVHDKVKLVCISFAIKGCCYVMW